MTALGDPEWPVRAMAAQALGKLGRPEAVEFLTSALGDKEWWVRINAAEALRSPGDAPVRFTPGIMLLCIAAGMGFGAFNEVIEFVATRILPDTNVGDYENTGWDLVSNLAGSVIAALIIRIRTASCGVGK